MFAQTNPMSDSLLIADFLEPLSLAAIVGDEELNDMQMGTKIDTYFHRFPDVDEAEIVIVGITEERGTGNGMSACKSHPQKFLPFVQLASAFKNCRCGQCKTRSFFK
jgi:hypothetical protein